VIELRYITPGYFETLGIPVRSGRAFTNADAAGAPRVVIVNETLARRYFAGIDPVGQQIDRGTIVGVAGDVKQAGLANETLADLYYPIAQNYSQVRDLGMSLIISTVIPPTGLVGPARDLINRSRANIAVFGVKTMDEIVKESLSDTSLYTWLVGSFAALTLVLACAGIYGVVSYGVLSRTREFGIRLALGADRRGVENLVLRQAAAVVVAGLALGLVGAFVTARFLDSLTAGAGRLAPAGIAAAAVLLCSAAFSACLVPARRAAAVDPMRALRQD
jgi:ABC-type antimicrobial peptide transport system permease subunit